MLGNKCAEIHARNKKMDEILEMIETATAEDDLIILRLNTFSTFEQYEKMRDELTQASNRRIFLVPFSVGTLEGLKKSRWLPRYQAGHGRTSVGYTCIICQNQNEHATKYCPNCGARMEER